jgi:hypothetical protein
MMSRSVITIIIMIMIIIIQIIIMRMPRIQGENQVSSFFVKGATCLRGKGPGTGELRYIGGGGKE